MARISIAAWCLALLGSAWHAAGEPKSPSPPPPPRQPKKRGDDSQKAAGEPKSPPPPPRQRKQRGDDSSPKARADAGEPKSPSPPPPPRQRKKRGDDSQKVALPHHSFAVPLEYTMLLEDWTASGASVFQRDRLLIHPAVKGLFGFAWTKKPVLTSDFEIIVHFRMEGQKTKAGVPTDQAMAVWYVAENVTSFYNETEIIKKKTTWQEGLQEQGFSFIGSKAKFDGFAAVLSPNAAGKSIVSVVSSNGDKTFDASKIPTSGKLAKEIDFRNTMNPAQLRIRVKPDVIEGSLKESPSLAWRPCFSVKRKTKTGGYVGISAFSGADKLDAEIKADSVVVLQVEVNNFDENVVGEEMKDVSTQIQEAYRDMLTDEHRHFTDQKSQTEHLARLTGMVSDYLTTTKPAEDRLFADVKALTGRVDQLSTECKNLRQEAHLLLNLDPKAETDLHKAGVEAMKKEILGLRRMLTKDGAEQRHKLDAVHKNVREVQKVSAAGQGEEALGGIMKMAETLEQTVTSRGTQMTWVLLVMMVSIIAIGGLMYNRMHYYEKKHFL